MTLKNDLSLFGVKPEELNPYERHFLLENPFPGHGETGFDVCTGQDTIKKAFVYRLQNFSSDAKRLCINGENGAGKTNILRYFERLTDEARRSRHIENLYPIYVYAPEESYFDIHGQIVDKLAESFLGDLLNTLQSDSSQIDALSSEVKPAVELLRVIKAITQPTQSAFLRQAERQEDALIRWMKGQKLSASDKKLLAYDGTPPAEITNSSLAIRFLNGLLTVLKELNLCDGIVLLFDEFEEIFEGLTRARQSRYAQDLQDCTKYKQTRHAFAEHLLRLIAEEGFAVKNWGRGTARSICNQRDALAYLDYLEDRDGVNHIHRRACHNLYAFNFEAARVRQKKKADELESFINSRMKSTVYRRTFEYATERAKFP